MAGCLVFNYLDIYHLQRYFLNTFFHYISLLHIHRSLCIFILFHKLVYIF